jgi:hypothetical protein
MTELVQGVAIGTPNAISVSTRSTPAGAVQRVELSYIDALGNERIISDTNPLPVQIAGAVYAFASLPSAITNAGRFVVVTGTSNGTVGAYAFGNQWFGTADNLPLTGPVTHTDWVAGALMFQDQGATTPVTAEGQPVRAWRNSAGQTLENAGGWTAIEIAGTLTPCAPLETPNAWELTSGPVNTNDLFVGVITSQRANPSYCVPIGIQGFGDPSVRVIEASAYLAGSYLYCGVLPLALSQTAIALANATLVSVATDDVVTTLHRGSIELATKAAPSVTSGTLRLGALGSAIATRLNGYVSRVCISSNANASANRARLNALITPLTGLTAFVSDSQTSVAINDNNTYDPNDCLAFRFSSLTNVLPLSIPGGLIGQFLSPSAIAAIQDEATRFNLDRVVVIATNDILSDTPTNYVNAITAFMANFGSGVKKIVVSPWDRAAPWSQAAAYNSAVGAFRSAVAASSNWVTLDGQALVVTAGHLAVDGVHMKRSGVAAVTAAILAV